MRFFKVKADIDDRLLNNQDGKNRQSGRKRSDEFDKRVNEYAKEVCLTDMSIAEESFGRDFFVNFSAINKVRATVIMAIDRPGEDIVVIKRYFEEYLNRHDYKGKIGRLDEVTGKHYRELLHEAYINDFIEDYEAAIELYKMNVVKRNRHSYGDFCYEEYLIGDKPLSYKNALRRAGGMKTVPELKAEIERIFSVQREQWRPGNPVHYVIAADPGKYRDEYMMLLLKALYICKRIDSKRFTQIDYEDICEDYNEEQLNGIYRLQAGGTVVIRIDNEAAPSGDLLSGNECRAEQICRMVTKWKNQVLSVFIFPRDSEKAQEAFYSEMDGISIIKIEECLVYDEDAKEYLRQLTRENAIRASQKLYGKIEPGTGYSKKDLQGIFDSWFDFHMRERLFPQYSREALLMSKAPQGPKGSGIVRLNNLIGLAETKALVSNILDFAKAQKIFAHDNGRRTQPLHMVFSGNPGTAKTTVARLVAQILKENEVLKNGELIEVGRADLIGLYVGHTAPNVKKAFARAKGSVLFIDEAYSLVEDRNGSYGDEAINTIVQEMENLRDEVVVIFAGYPDKMEGFLSKNPGLRSRIGFHVNFPDYTPGELYEILELIAQERKIGLAEDVFERVFPMIERAAAVKEFGNGRYVRNLLEKACMRQATRLLEMDRSAVTKQVAATLIADDFEELKLTGRSETGRKIGF